ncbi:histidine kinase [Paenibacillus sp. KQZ6P-2]|uniref:histidine kinase n=1 Tax=Paenibacillus mangrovi TaxID=2931978 RepID=A0A9X1WU49_9BACL|nr:histidine kinase [Paenibacillus mangrovi]MCJ8013633.1 histidine kinase [Paenibacillus mangrovi]
MKRGIIIKTPRTLKSRMIAILLLTTLIPLALLGAVSILSIEKMTNKKIENGLFNALKLTSSNLESTLNNMDYVSLQLTSEGSVGQKLFNYLSMDSRYQKLELSQDIQSNMNLVNFTNPSLGLILYHLTKGNEILFQNMNIRPDADFFKLPLLAKWKGVVFSGPHTTLYRYGNNQVFSLLRPIYDPSGGSNDNQVYVYIETNLKLFEQILNKQQYGMTASNVLINDQGIIVYSDSVDDYKPGMRYSVPESIGTTFKTIKGNQYIFGQRNEQGWSLLAVIDKKDYQKEFNSWLWMFVLIVCTGLIISLLFAYALWGMVYRPLRKVGKDIKLMADNRFTSSIPYTNIAEFDVLVHTSYQMRNRIQELISDVEQREINKRKLEVEKLLYQINPHFIHNTLNTIQWLAKMNGQNEIDQLVSVFTRVLNYNLGKKGEVVPLKAELEALQDYAALQRIRYDHQFKVISDIDEGLLEINIPRFILQPIVENAFYHGLHDENGMITVSIHRGSGHSMLIEVKDNGQGMTPEEISQVIAEEKNPLKESGLGIGLDYVKRMLKASYGVQCQFKIESYVGQGTVVTLIIPLQFPKVITNNVYENGHNQLENSHSR